MILYANADKTKIVAADDPEARFVVNTDHPEGFEAALRDYAEAKAKQPAQNKAQSAGANK